MSVSKQALLKRSHKFLSISNVTNLSPLDFALFVFFFNLSPVSNLYRYIEI